MNPAAMNLVVINGPNLNLLGTREPAIYGSETLSDLEAQWQARANLLGIDVDSFQSNHEGAIIDAIHDARDTTDGIVLNAGALSHYSLALADALAAVDIPYVEIHISNIHEREEWRHHSVLSEHADAVIVGRGTAGYLDAISHLHAVLTAPPATVAYGDDPDQVLDVRTPEGSGPHPTVLLIHGGYWRPIWTRDLMDPVAIALGELGWATVNMEYRKGPGSFPKPCEDVDAAIAWVGNAGLEHNLDPDHLAVIGHSAGGWLALKAAHTHDNLRGVIGLNAVTDLPSVRVERPDDPAALFLGATEAARPDLWQEAGIAGDPLSPVHVLHGADDESVSRAQAELYDRRTNTSAVVAIVEDVGHDEFIDPYSGAWDFVVKALNHVTG